MCERVEQTVTSVRKAAWRKMRNLLHALGMSYEEGGTPSPVKKKAWIRHHHRRHSCNRVTKRCTDCRRKYSKYKRWGDCSNWSSYEKSMGSIISLSLLMCIFIHFLSSYLQGTHKLFVVFYYSKHLDIVFPSEHSKLSVWLPNPMCSYIPIIKMVILFKIGTFYIFDLIKLEINMPRILIQLDEKSY